MRVHSWAPGHATLFFSVPEAHDDPSRKGSLGAGFNFASGVHTIVEFGNEDKVYWNGKKINGKVTRTAIDRFKTIYSIDQSFVIHHKSELKIGHGLSTSGAGTIGTVLGLNSICGTDIQTTDLYEIAHYADAINHTGLGSVVGQMTGGVEIRNKLGGPKIGKTTHIPADDKMIILMKDKLHTDQVLQSSKKMKIVTETGIECLQRAMKIKANHVEEFIKIGRYFTERCGLMTDQIATILSKLDDIGEDLATMAMIGETIVVKPKNPEAVVRFGRRYKMRSIVTKIENQKPQLIQDLN